MDDEGQLEFIQRAVRGDFDALTHLLEQSRGSLQTWLREKIPAELRAVVAVDDIVQEAHVEAFRHIRTFEPHHTEAFYHWLGTIAARKLRDAVKKQHAAKRGAGYVPRDFSPAELDDSLLALADRVQSADPSPSRCVSRREAAAAVRSALAALPQDYQQALWLVYIERQPVAIVAEEMGRSERAVHGLCRRGLRRLRDTLGDASGFLTWTG